MERRLHGSSFFSHDQTNSCGVAIAYFGTKDPKMASKTSDKNGRIPILNVILYDTDFLLINFITPIQSRISYVLFLLYRNYQK